MATNDRNAPAKEGRTKRGKDTEPNRDSLAFYAEKAPEGTSTTAIIGAYHSDKRASEIEDWGEYDA